MSQQIVPGPDYQMRYVTIFTAQLMLVWVQSVHRQTGDLRPCPFVFLFLFLSNPQLVHPVLLDCQHACLRQRLLDCHLGLCVPGHIPWRQPRLEYHGSQLSDVGSCRHRPPQLHSSPNEPGESLCAHVSSCSLRLDASAT